MCDVRSHASRTLLPLERAVARVCSKAGARVARNMRLADMNLLTPVHDARRIPLAVDTTLVSPLTQAGEARPGADSRPNCNVPAVAAW